ncbi:MAG: hypothetical protein EOP06_08300 [Proteobacteria bacterium]|nr:MAG: hypothetical protein EOP06_08300 [Pseudomonadota bacterium]
MKTLVTLLSFALLPLTAFAQAPTDCSNRTDVAKAMSCVTEEAGIETFNVICLLKGTAPQLLGAAVIEAWQLPNGAPVMTNKADVAEGEYTYSFKPSNVSFGSAANGISFEQCLDLNVGGGAGASIGN